MAVFEAPAFAVQALPDQMGELGREVGFGQKGGVAIAKFAAEGIGAVAAAENDL